MMIAFLIFDDKTAVYEMKRRTTVRIYGTELVFLYKGRRFAYVRNSSVKLLRYCGIVEDEEMILYFPRENKTARIIFSSSEGYHKTVFYELRRKITVGTDIEDDFYICSDHLTHGCLEIDPFHMKVKAAADIPVSLNGRRICHEVSFNNGDVLRCLNLRIVLNKRFLCTNDCENITCILPLYTSEHSSIPYLPMNRPVLRSLPEPYLPSFEHEVHLKEFSLPPEPEQRSMLASAGPVLMMSSASLLSAALMYASSSSKNTAGLFVSVLLPVSMLASTLIFTPMNIRNETEKAGKRRMAAISEYSTSLRNTAAGIQERRLSYSAEAENMFPEDYEYSYRTNSCFLLRIGCSAEILNVKVQENAAAGLFAKEYTELERIQKDTEYRPLIIDLHRYRRIGITAGNGTGFIYSILARLNAMHRSTILFIEREQLRNAGQLLDLACLANKNGERLVFTELPDKAELFRLMDEHSEYILLYAMETEISAGLREESRIMTVISLSDDDADLLISGTEDDLVIEDRLNGTNRYFKPDPLPDPKRIAASAVPLRNESKHTFLAMYNAEKAENLDISAIRTFYEKKRGLKALIGYGEEDELVALDLAENGDGPHGMIAGTTGSGKSELLSTMILSLAVNYSPEHLQFILIDFKGGGISSVFSSGNTPLAHLSGTLTNLDDDLKERVLFALRNECIRREKCFLSAASEGYSVRKLEEYNRRMSETGEKSMPELAVVVDEFAQLKAEYPEFLKELIAIARIGRSLGIHLILATQKPAGSMSDEIRANMKFRICLRTADRNDSMEVLHSPEASALRKPGEFMMLKEGEIIHGQSAYVHSFCKKGYANELLTIQRTRAFSELPGDKSEENEIQTVLARIAALNARNQCAGKLWKDRLPEISVSELPVSSNVIGIADDYEKGSQPYLALSDSPCICCFFTKSDEKRKDISDLLMVVYKRNGYDVSVISSDVKIIADAEKCGCCMIHEEELNGFAKNMSGTVLILTDTEQLLRRNEKNKQLLSELIADHKKRNLSLMIIAGSAGVFSYREQMMLTNRYCLGDLSLKEVSAVFESRCRIKAYSNEGGYYMEDKPGIFRYARVKESDFKELCRNS